MTLRARSKAARLHAYRSDGASVFTMATSVAIELRDPVIQACGDRFARAIGLCYYANMALTAERTTSIISDYRRDEKDSGSAEVQVALLTERIIELTGHLRTHKHDFASRRGLLMMVSRRNRLLRYLSRTDRPRYLELIGRLGLRK
jgi:small subunit ribosomal protein S15